VQILASILGPTRLRIAVVSKINHISELYLSFETAEDESVQILFTTENHLLTADPE